MALKPCKRGTKRNPLTRRCRKVKKSIGKKKRVARRRPAKKSAKRATRRVTRRKSAAPRAYAPCKLGYERNPKTKRCRRVTGMAMPFSVTSQPGSIQMLPDVPGSSGPVVVLSQSDIKNRPSSSQYRKASSNVKNFEKLQRAANVPLSSTSF